MYSAAGQQVHYLPQYYSTPYAQFAPSPYPDRTIKPERRRPKYTRSKTGCLTCRKKKVKCDETKSVCQRCANSQLDCAWPEIPPLKKKGPARKRVSTADQDSIAASDAGTSSLSPSATGSVEGTPQPSTEDEQASAIGPQLSFTDPNSLHVGVGVSNHRRHSDPHLQTPLGSASAIGPRSHSAAGVADGHFAQSSSGGSNGSALGLTLNQINGTGASTRASTPNDYLYPQPVPGAYATYSPSGSMQVLPNISAGTGVSSRPSTASSLSLSHSLVRRTSAGSRPSTASSHSGSIHQHQYDFHRPASAAGVLGNPGANDALPLGLSPFSFQMGAAARDAPLDAAALSGYASVSRPSTANSTASTSPFMRHVQGHGPGEDVRWQPSPMLSHSPLVHQHTVDGYFAQNLLHSPPQHHHQSRPQSPSWCC
ncbi:hypothetical protein DFH11DRAFT_728219 [Phellopilus nigrolimitatus]|nr:hypothetical protein DFH11DRAFT_728219 [Phellopilus nigrolimitatus]